MVLRTALALVATLALALSGCLGSTPDDAGDTRTHTDAHDDGSAHYGSPLTQEATQAPESPEPPYARVALSADRGAWTPQDDGAPIYRLPRGVDATFDAGASDDPAGGALHYTWAFSDGQILRGATVTREFRETGAYTATLTATSLASHLASTHHYTLEVYYEDPPEGTAFFGELYVAAPGEPSVPPATGPDVALHAADAYDFEVKTMPDALIVRIDPGYIPTTGMSVCVMDPDGQAAACGAYVTDPTGRLHAGDRTLEIEDPVRLAKLGTWSLAIDDVRPAHATDHAISVSFT